MDRQTKKIWPGHEIFFTEVVNLEEKEELPVEEDKPAEDWMELVDQKHGISCWNLNESGMC